MLGKDPDIVNLLSLEHLHGPSPFAAKFVRLLHQLNNMKERGEWTEYATPGTVLAWAGAHQVEVSPKLSESIEAYSAARDAERAAWWADLVDDNESHEPELTPTERTASAKERESLKKMIIAMAVDKYGYRPGALKSKVPQEVANPAERLGLRLTDDTCRKWLSESGDILDQDVINDLAAAWNTRRPGAPARMNPLSSSG